MTKKIQRISWIKSCFNSKHDYWCRKTIFKNSNCRRCWLSISSRKKSLILNLGFTHPIQFEIPEDLIIKVESNTKIQLLGIDREKLVFCS